MEFTITRVSNGFILKGAEQTVFTNIDDLVLALNEQLGGGLTLQKPQPAPVAEPAPEAPVEQPAPTE